MSSGSRSVRTHAPIGVEQLLSEPFALGLFREAGANIESARPQYFRPKAGGGAIVAYRLEGVDPEGVPVSLPGYVRLAPYDEPGRLAERWVTLRPVPTPLGPGIRTLAGGPATLFLFPNDAGLRKLRFVAAPDRLKRVMADVEVIGGQGYRVRGRHTDVRAIRYKPERRFVAHARLAMVQDATGQRDSQEVFIRLFRDRRAVRIERIARLLRANTLPTLFPRPLGTALAGRLFVEEAVEGRELFDAVLDGAADPDELIEAVSSLHRSGCDLRERLRIADVLRRLRDGAEMLALAEPGLGAQADRLLDRLIDMAPTDGTPALVHGDLHLHQILATSHGPVIVDLERAGMGDPLLDVGELVAHLVELAEERPHARPQVENFRLAVEEALSGSSAFGRREHLAFFIASALSNRALLRIRGMSPNRQEWAGRLLDLAWSWTDRRSRGEGDPFFFTRSEPVAAGFLWEVFYPQQAGPWPGFLVRPEQRRGSGDGGGGEDVGGHRVYGLYDADAGTFRAVSPHADPALPSLRLWAGKGEIVSYRVSKRATVRIEESAEVEPVYVKVLTPRKAQRLLARTRMVEAARRTSGDPRFPRTAPLLEAVPDEGVMIYQAVPGTSLHELLMLGDPGVLESLDRTAAAMRAMHEVDALALGLERLRPAPPLAFYEALAVRYFPERARKYRDVLRTIRDHDQGGTPEGHILIHGDLHDKNVIIDDGEVTLLDLDLLRPGRPEEDVGNLAAHLILRGRQRDDDLGSCRNLADRFLAAYSDSGGGLDDGVTRATAATLFRLSCLYLFRRRWQQITGDLLEEARRWAQVPATRRA